jgi:hypothetical protein
VNAADPLPAGKTAASLSNDRYVLDSTIVRGGIRPGSATAAPPPPRHSCTTFAVWRAATGSPDAGTSLNRIRQIIRVNLRSAWS